MCAVDEPKHRSEWIAKSASATNAVTVLKYYGLIQQRVRNINKPFDRSGRWVITQRGKDWIEGCIFVPTYAYTIHGEVVAYSEERMSFEEAFTADADPEEAANSDVRDAIPPPGEENV
jgi:hypothetical protein